MTFQVSKPGVPWPEIKERYRRGEGSTVICRDYDISRQAIEARARRGNWGKTKIDVTDALQITYLDDILSLPSISNQATPESHSENQIANWGQRSPRNLAVILEAVDEGMSLTRSAKLAGISETTLGAWIDADPKLQRLIHQHQRKFELEMIKYQVAAAERGDWKAGAHLLTQSEKSGYAVDQAEKGGITVVLNVPRPEMVDITPK